MESPPTHILNRFALQIFKASVLSSYWIRFAIYIFIGKIKPIWINCIYLRTIKGEDRRMLCIQLAGEGWGQIVKQINSRADRQIVGKIDKQSGRQIDCWVEDEPKEAGIQFGQRMGVLILEDFLAQISIQLSIWVSLVLYSLLIGHFYFPTR